MTTPSQGRAAWLEERMLGCGGSDIASVFNVGYGCRRRLWYTKRRTPEDFPRATTRPMELGNALEPLFAEWYREDTGRRVFTLKEPMNSAECPELRVNLDRLVVREGIPGAMEIKSVDREIYYRVKREGVWPDAILQLQAGMIASKTEWGVYVVGLRGTGDLVHFDVERDDAACREIISEVPIFWAQVQNGPIPDALEPDDRRCSKCEFRVTCQGNALVQLKPEGELAQAPDLAGLVQEKVERDELYDQAVELCEETDEELKTALGGRQAVIVNGRPLYHRPQKGRLLVDGKRLLDSYRRAWKLVADGLRIIAPSMGIDGFDHAAIEAATLKELPPPESFVSESKPSQPLRLMPMKGGK